MDTPKLYLAKFFRYIWDEKNLVIVIGESKEIIKGMKEYHKRYRIPMPKKDVVKLLERTFLAGGMAAVSLADRESWGWSISFPDSDLGVFASFDPEGSVCGKVNTTPKDKNLTVIQRQKEGKDVTQSSIVANGSQPEDIIEQYFSESVQTACRIAVDGNKGAMAIALPDPDLSEISEMSDKEFIDTCDKLVKSQAFKKLSEVLLFYECRCSDEMILEMVTNLPEDQRKALWGDLPKLDIECPRCGRNYSIKRKMDNSQN